MAEVTLRGKTFPARDDPSEWELMKLADGYTGNTTVSMAAMYRFLRYALGDAWLDFETHMDGLAADGATGLYKACDDAIGDYLKSASGRPTETPSDSPASQQTMSDTSKVASISQASRRVSLSRGLIKVERAEPDTGGSSSDAAAG